MSASETPATAASQPIDYSTTLDERTKRYTVAAAMLGLFLAALDQTIVATATPRIAQEFNGFGLYTWVTIAYILASTAMVPIYGKLSDIYGRKAILLTGIVLFLAASVACGASTSMEMLVVMRAFQGMGAAALSSTAFAVVADLYEPRKRAKMQGVFGAVFGITSIIGPVLGGVLTQHFSWRAVFYVNVPFGAVAVAFVLMKMPSLKNGLDATIDFLGAALVIAGAVPMMLALNLVPMGHAPTSPLVLGLFFGGLASFVLFVAVERRVKDPILPMRLFGNRAFASAALVSFLFGGLFFGAILFIPLFMREALGVSDTQAGTALLPLSLVMSPGAILGGRLAARSGKARPFIIGGLIVATSGYLLLSMLDVTSTRLTVGMRLAVLAIGLGPNLSLLTLVLQNSVDRRDIGIATSARQFFQQLGGAFGAALLGAVLATTLPRQVELELAPVAAQLRPADQAELARLARNKPAAGEGGPSRGGAHNPFAPLFQRLRDETRRQLDEARHRLQASTDPTDENRAQLAALELTEQSALATYDREEADALAAWRRAHASTIAHLFLWAMALGLVTLVVAFFLRDPPLGSSTHPGPPTPVEI